MLLTMTAAIHIPVMVDEAIQALAVRPGGRYVDCTLGGGGHAQAILRRSAPDGRLLGIDADPQAVETARERLTPYGERAVIVQDNFTNLKAICEANGFASVDGILFDLGLSAMLLESSRRGFSFNRDEPLDMRFSPGQEVTAADIVNTYSEAELAELITTLGEEHLGRRIARQIVHERPLQTTAELVEVITQAAGGRRGRINPATRTFQALRIAVNDELGALERMLPQAVEVLASGGRLAIISFHSLEDRVVKEFFRREAKGCICPPEAPVCTCGRKPRLRLVTRRPIEPSPEECARNPRSRSAKLRVAERL